MSENSMQINFVEFQQNVEANYLQLLLGFSGLLEEYLESKCIDEEIFAILISESVRHFNISAQEFSKEFDVHSSTVGRWVSGTSAPNKMVRSIILKWIYERLETDIQEYLKKTSNVAFNRMSELISSKKSQLRLVAGTEN